MRNYWREMKRKSRANASAQKVRRTKEYDRARKENVEEQKLESSSVPTSPNVTRRAVYRTKKSLPRDPDAAAAVISKVIKSPDIKTKLEGMGMTIISPRKMKALDHLVQSCQELLKKSNKKKKITLLKALTQKYENIKKYENLKCTSKLLGIRFAYVKKISDLSEEELTTRSDRLSQEHEDLIKEFYMDPMMTTVLPGKKKASSKLKKPGYILNQSLKQTYSQFNERHPGIVKFSKFQKLRPAHVKLSKSHKWRQCLCPSCTNVELKIEVMKKMPNIQTEIKSKYDIMHATLCQREEGQEFNHLKCIDRKCSDCGVHLLRDKIECDPNV